MLARWSRIRTNLRHDLPASLVVFLIAVPLSLGIATASGAPLLAGLIAAVVGGVVAGLLGGSALQVSGPAAGLTVVVAELVGQFGWAVTCAITVLAGLLQIALGASRIGRAALAISPTVVHAMLAGIGITIVLSQAHVLLGGTAKGNAIENLRALPASLLNLRPAAAAVGILVVAALIVWPRLPASVRRVPGQLVAIVVATLLAAGLSLDVARVDLPGSPLSAIALPELPHDKWGAFALGVVTMTIIASVESLLSAVAVDKMHHGPRADLDRELIGQGAANTVSGLLGGLPVTGVIMRSSANVAAGARSRMSAVLHGAWVLLFSLLLVNVIELIPMAALAGLLVITGAQLVKLVDIRRAHAHGELLVYLATVSGVVLLNLLEGVLIGLVVALLTTLRRVVWASVRVERSPEKWSIYVEGTLSFLSIPKLAKELGRIPAGAEVHLELVIDYLDHAAFEHLSSWLRQHERAGGAVAVHEIGGSALAKAAGKASLLPRWFSPWSTWAAADGIPLPRSADHKLEAGVRDYHRRSLPVLRSHLQKLADGQEPAALFLTCADSRIVPNVITSSGPGDLFTVRNVGNLVPPSTTDPTTAPSADPTAAPSAGTPTGTSVAKAGTPADTSVATAGTPVATADTSVAASVEFAVRHLGVPTIMVCGHSSCGAMKALLGAQKPAGPLGDWLRHADASLAALRGGHPVDHPELSEPDRLSMINVAVQLENLRTMPAVAEAEAAGTLRLTGLFYDIPTGRLLKLDSATNRFEPMPGLAEAQV